MLVEGRLPAATALFSSFQQLDRLLRGEATQPGVMRGGALHVSVWGLTHVIVLLAMIYGICMGSYSLLKEVPPELRGDNGRYWQLVATTIKVPALFCLTLLVTFPSLYVFNALVGSRLRMLAVLKLLVASLAVNVAVLASLGPIVLFFSLSTKDYPFIVLLNVAAFGVAGILGLVFLLQTLHRLTALAEATPLARESRGGSDFDEAEIEKVLKNDAASAVDPSALDMPSGQTFSHHTRLVFRCWVVLFGIVGAQMGWVLRPFVGNPYEPFAWFRERGSNFFADVLQKLVAIFTGGG